jgi:hypothetical protein
VSQLIFTQESVVPSPPASGLIAMYTLAGVVYVQNSVGTVTAIGVANGITALTGDVSASGPGSATATVNFVGGQSAANVAAATVLVETATSSNVPSSLVERDSSGNFSAGTITANLNGNASTSSSSVTSIDFSGSLAGDVTGGQSTTHVALVGGQTASAVSAAAVAVADAASINTPGTLVERDGTGSFSAGTITASLTGNVTGNVSGSSSTFTGTLSGDVTGTQSATTVTKIQGFAVSNSTPTDAQMLVYNTTTNNWTPVSVSGDVSLVDTGATSIASTTVTGKLLTGYTVGTNTPILATDSILSAFEKVQGQLNSASGSAITALTGDGTATGPGSVPFTLATVNSNTGTFASVTVNGKGLVTAASALSGDATTSGSAITLATVNSTTGSFGSQTQVASFTVNGKGLITAASNVTIGNLTNSNLSGSAGITGANIASSTISNTNLAQMAANTVKANTSGVPANPVDTALGTLTEATSSVLTLTGWTDATIGSPTIQVLQATTSQSGYLSSTDWNTFNNKQTAGAYITALTGDVTGTGPGATATTVAKIQGTTVSGTTGTGNVVFSASPTFTGTLAAGAVTATSITDSSLTSGSVLFSGAGGLVTQDNAKFFWDDTNFTLGIGQQPQAASTITTLNTSGAAKPIWQFSYGVGSTTGLRGDFARGTVLAPAAAQAGDVLNFISGRGYGASQFATSSTAAMQLVAAETFTNTSNATYVAFKTTPTGSVTSAERLRINTTGNILVGTTTDNATDLMQVNGSINVVATAGAGYVSFTSQSAAPSTPTGSFRLYADSLSRLAWVGTNGFTRTFDGSANTANRVYTLPDTSGQIATSQMITAFKTAVVALAFGANVATDASTGNIFTLTLTGTANISAPTNPTDGQKITYRIAQDATGNRALTFDPIFNFGNSVYSNTLTPSKTDYIGCQYNGSTSRWDVLAFSKGF